MKTPEEIKRGMEIYLSNDDNTCEELCFVEENDCPYTGLPQQTGKSCGEIILADALVYIRQLEQDNAQKDERIRQLEQRVPRWISVEERLPESGVRVLVTAKTPGGHKYVCDAFHAEKFSISSEYGDELACEYNPEKDEYFLEEGWYEVIKNWDDYSSIVIQDQVTHWMPLPEPPEEEPHEDPRP